MASLLQTVVDSRRSAPKVLVQLECDDSRFDLIFEANLF